MSKCLKCGYKRKNKTLLDLLKPCSNCGCTINEEIAIADREIKDKE